MMISSLSYSYFFIGSSAIEVSFYFLGWHASSIVMTDAPVFLPLRRLPLHHLTSMKFVLNQSLTIKLWLILATCPLFGLKQVHTLRIDRRSTHSQSRSFRGSDVSGKSRERSKSLRYTRSGLRGTRRCDSLYGNSRSFLCRERALR